MEIMDYMLEKWQEGRRLLGRKINITSLMWLAAILYIITLMFS